MPANIIIFIVYKKMAKYYEHHLVFLKIIIRPYFTNEFHFYWYR